MKLGKLYKLKKDYQVMAIQYVNDNKVDVQKFYGKYLEYQGTDLLVDTIQGLKHLKFGDYLVKDIHGFFFVIKANKFKRDYIEI